MKIHCLSRVAVVLAASMLATVSPWAAAQSAAPPASGASAPAAAKPGPRTLTPAEKRDNATPPDESRPEGPVVPQISIPLGKSLPASSKPTLPTLRPPRPAAAASAGGVNDAVARCEAQADESLRAKCRDRLSHQGTRP
jgi:hypothetical protein